MRSCCSTGTRMVLKLMTISPSGSSRDVHALIGYAAVGPKGPSSCSPEAFSGHVKRRFRPQLRCRIKDIAIVIGAAEAASRAMSNWPDEETDEPGRPPQLLQGRE